MYHDVVLLGVLVGLIFGELTGLSPAGLIVPGYIVLTLKTPERVAYTLAVALAASLAARLLSNVTILYGRRRFAVMIFLAYAVDALVMAAGFWWLTPAPGVIGVLIPGIIANEFDRQGTVRSLLALGCVVGIICLILLAAGVPVLRL